MIYSALIYEAAGLSDARPSEEQQQVLDRHRALQNDTKASGAYRAAVQLAETPSSSIRHKGGETLVTDGPFAETKEQLGGFYLLNCKDLDEAIVYAAKIPLAPTGSVEVRPVMEFE